jgi:hypothetical protein
MPSALVPNHRRAQVALAAQAECVDDDLAVQAAQAAQAALLVGPVGVSLCHHGRLLLAA